MAEPFSIETKLSYPGFFLDILVHICTVYLSGTEDALLWSRALSENFWNLEYLDWLKMHFPAWSKVF